jgi:hypothetical protein
VVLALVFGLVGYLCSLLRYSRAALLIGFVLGQPIEYNLNLALLIDGPFFFLQPIPLVLCLVAAAFLAHSLLGVLRETRQTRASPTGKLPPERAGDPQRSVDLLSLETICLAVCGTAALAALAETLLSGRGTVSVALTVLVPLIACLALQARRVGAMRAGILGRTSARLRWPRTDAIGRFSLGIAGFLGLLLVAGHYAALLVLVFGLVRSSGRDGVLRAAGVAVACTGAIFVLFDGVLGIEMYRGLVFRHLAGFRDF